MILGQVRAWFDYLHINIVGPPDFRSDEKKHQTECWFAEIMRFTLLSHCHTDISVASRAEAWIETICWPAACWRATRRLPRGGVDRNRDRADHGRWRNVASRAEAWIETCSEPSPMSANRRRLPRGGVDRNLTPAPGTAMIVSPPARRRGSKHHVIDVVILHHASPPARRRGSKHELLADSLVRLVSPPARRRGSKLVRSAIVRQNAQVASRAEAWIETCASMATGRRPMVASRAEAWIETEQTGL